MIEGRLLGQGSPRLPGSGQSTVSHLARCLSEDGSPGAATREDSGGSLE